MNAGLLMCSVDLIVRRLLYVDVELKLVDTSAIIATTLDAKLQFLKSNRISSLESEEILVSTSLI